MYDEMIAFLLGRNTMLSDMDLEYLMDLLAVILKVEPEYSMLAKETTKPGLKKFIKRKSTEKLDVILKRLQEYPFDDDEEDNQSFSSTENDAVKKIKNSCSADQKFIERKKRLDNIKFESVCNRTCEKIREDNTFLKSLGLKTLNFDDDPEKFTEKGKRLLSQDTENSFSVKENPCVHKSKSDVTKSIDDIQDSISIEDSQKKIKEPKEEKRIYTNNTPSVIEEISEKSVNLPSDEEVTKNENCLFKNLKQQENTNAINSIKPSEIFATNNFPEQNILSTKYSDYEFIFNKGELQSLHEECSSQEYIFE